MTTRLIKRSLFAVMAALIGTLAPSTTRADVLVSGGTLAWSVKGKYDPKLKTIVPVVGKKEEGKDIGVTVLCTVYDRAEGNIGDPWGTGIKNLDKMLTRGYDPTGRRSPELDRSARYLYVYQVIADYPDKQERIRSVSIRLLVEPYRITSWGYFEEKADAKIKGVSFALPTPEGKDKKSILHAIVPVAYGEAPKEGEARLFTEVGAFQKIPQLGMIAGIAINNNNAPKKVAFDTDPGVLSSFTGRVPDGVVLMPLGNFEGAPAPELPARSSSVGVPPIQAMPFIGGPYFGAAYAGPLYQVPFGYPSAYIPSSVLYNPGYTVPATIGAGLYRPYMGVAPVGYGTEIGVGTGEQREGYAALRVDFTDPVDGELRYDQRSTIFGFTSNDGPVEDVVRARGFVATEVAVAPGAPVPGNLLSSGDGRLIVPVAGPEPAVGGVGGASFPLLGGGITGTTGGTTGGGGFGGFPGPGIGGIGTAPGGFGGGGGGPLGGGQAQQQNATPTQQQQQQQNTTPTPTPSNNTVTVTVSQSGATSTSSSTSSNASTSSSNSSNSSTNNATNSNTNNNTNNANNTNTNTNTNINNLRQNQNQFQNQHQSQNQNQHQNQHQHQQQHGKHGHVPVHVIPEPAAMVTAALGLPVFWLFRRRRNEVCVQK